MSANFITLQYLKDLLSFPYDVKVITPSLFCKLFNKIIKLFFIQYQNNSFIELLKSLEINRNLVSIGFVIGK
ncbi:hypothetical protein GCM10011339_28080 [Echinicola rosea]|uniref:Uncharacterized protein n=1 Tax=Echinicola rosea TaxID=1807691 RepID=A0ABQ1V3Z0_9BACT|nr:hypothetical protein GCM10011339_28080 [Echinicola rosea]